MFKLIYFSILGILFCLYFIYLKEEKNV